MELDKKILSLALHDKKFALELTETLNEKYFIKEYRWLFSAIVFFFKDPNIKSIPTNNMIEEYLGDNINASELLNTYNCIKASEIDPNEFSWLLQKLKQRYNNTVQKEFKNKINDTFSKLPANINRIDEVNKLIKESVVEIDSIYKHTIYREGSLKDSAEERQKNYEYLELHPESARGILTGFSHFDKITNGLHPGELMIIAGDTGSGKSIVMHNVAVNAYLGNNNPFMNLKECDDSGRNVLVFSLEMPKETMERRVDACMAGVFSNHIRDGILNDEDKEKYFRVLNFQKQYKKNFHIVDMPKNVTTRDIEIKFLEISETSFKPDLVVIDYMGIMSAGAEKTSGVDWMDLGFISAELHEFARSYEVSVVTGSQVNKTKDGGERYDTNRLARSGMIPTNANIIIQIANRPDEDLRTDMTIFITKMRDGEKNSFVLSKDFGRMKVVDLADSGFFDGEGDNDI